MSVHQNFESINRLVESASGEAAFWLGRLVATAEDDHVILDDAILEQIANANDFNDVIGYYAVWLLKRTEANGGVKKHDW